MSISKNRGQASLEMVVGLIILLVIAGVVIGLVMTTMNKGNLEGVTGGAAGKFMDNCKIYCDNKDYLSYCTATMSDISSSTDWNGDGQTGRLLEDTKVSLWPFCEDRVYCFLVTSCAGMGMQQCGAYVCQRYTEKYGSTSDAIAKLKEIYRMSDEPTKCCRKDKNNVERCISQLGAKENWLKVGFVDKGWCVGSSEGGINLENCGDGICDTLFGESGNNCPSDCFCGDGVCDSVTESASSCSQDCSSGGGGGGGTTVTLSGCIYNSTDDSMTCDTNCQGTVAGATTTLFVMDNGGTGNSSIAMDGTTPVGTISVSGNKVTAKPAVFAVMGAVALSSLDPNTAAWVVSISCQNPVGNAMSATGVTRV